MYERNFVFPYERFFVLTRKRYFLFFLRVRFFGFSEENNSQDYQALVRGRTLVREGVVLHPVRW